MINLQIFNQIEFIQAIKSFFKELNVPMNSVSDEPTTAKDILQDFYKNNSTFQLIDDVYFAGMIDDAAFAENQSLDPAKIKSDYDGILVFGITLNKRNNDLLPTRSQLAEISRAFNRAFYFTPVVVIFKYGKHLAFANTERLKHKQEWREGEKAGKVSLLRDINIDKPHSGHERILTELEIPTSGNKKVDSFSKLYTYWQDVFSVSLLNKKFYQELSNWYFWATKHVTFPGEPSIEDAHRKNAKREDLLQEHRATNVIRLLTRLLFVWFIKEKKLIPEELFELEDLQKDILKDISPYNQVGSLFSERNAESVYYKAILQNLFFATLNCPIEGDSLDKRKREFRKDNYYGQDRGNDWMLRYKRYFKNSNTFLTLLNNTTPFLNGGLFECLDDKNSDIYIDGFSDQMTKGEQLVVPDYLFFGLEEEADLSDIVGIKDKKYKQAAVKGLINILKSYKFTITENTPIEEDVALDPELLGKVFENLLASYNPETKTTARKQTGSFYTPREIVNYMVDESLIAYLKNAINDWKGLDDDTVDKELHILTSFDNKVPFTNHPDLQIEIISVLSTCTILDPACGSGAFPMGILQKMVHILQKLDPDNRTWKEVQLGKARKESEAAFEIEDKQAREEHLIEINNAFDQSINDPDYARKLFLVENCIYGVDIQPIATQISKLRFFISLVVEQKVNTQKDNFGIRPLPNLETKFVAANTLIGIEKENNLFSTDEIKELEKQLKKTRSKLFSARTKETKVKYRNLDKGLRNQIAEKLKAQGLPVENAEKLSAWDPYDQNSSSTFFDPEWMFDMKDGFNIVIGNPPYVQLQKDGGSLAKLYQKYKYDTFERTGDIYSLFYERGVKLLNDKGILCYITSNKWMRANYGASTRQFFAEKTNPLLLIDFGNIQVFETATVDTNILILENKPKSKRHQNKDTFAVRINNDFNIEYQNLRDYVLSNGYFLTSLNHNAWVVGERDIYDIKDFIEQQGAPLSTWKISINYGIKSGTQDAFMVREDVKDKLVKDDPKCEVLLKKLLRGKDVSAWYPDYNNYWLIGTFPSLNIDINDYPSIKKHLIDYGREKLEQDGKGRKKTGNKWFETQDQILYWRNFEKPKLIYPEITKYIPFIYDEIDHFYTNNKCFILSGERLKYLTCIFNSKLFKYCFLDNFPELQGGSRELRKVFFEKIPIKQITDEQEVPFAKMVDYLVALKKEKSTESSDQLMFVYFEQIVNALIYEFYFREEFENAKLIVAKPIAQLPNLTTDERVIVQLRKLYVTLNKEENPIKQAVSSMLSIPQVNLINNSISW